MFIFTFMNIKITQEKIVKITDQETGKTLKINMPIDFEVTDNWAKEQIKDPELTKCIKWLKDKGFHLDSNKRWSYDGDSIHLVIPQFFITDENVLRVQFGTIENCTSILFPRPNRMYMSLKGFPLKVSPKRKFTHFSTNNVTYDGKPMKWININYLDAYLAYIEGRIKYEDMDAYYFKSEIERDPQHRSLETNEDLLNKNVTYLNVKSSLESINKFSI